MQHLEVSGAVRPLKWSLDVKWLSRVWWSGQPIRSILKGQEIQDGSR